MAVHVLQESSQTCAELHLRCAGRRDDKRIEHTEIMSGVNTESQILQIQFGFLRTSDSRILHDMTR